MRAWLHTSVFFLLLLAAGGHLHAQPRPGGNPFSSELETRIFAASDQLNPADAASFLLAGSPSATQADVHKATELIRIQAHALAENAARNPVDAVFRGMRANWLRSYLPGADLGDVFRNGEFNCVSGTALMALAFECLGMKTEIREQSKHVYLYVKDGDQSYRLETTAHDFGAIRSKAKANAAEKSISLLELAGLQYYNRGLLALDREDAADAVDQFRKAAVLYPSSRVAEMQGHAAKLCLESGLEALKSGHWDAALGMLERAWLPTAQNPVLDLALSAAILHKAEHCSSVTESQAFLSAYGRWNPQLFSVPEFSASYAECCLLIAQDKFNLAHARAEAQATLVELEARHPIQTLDVDPFLAAGVYRAAFLHALQIQDFARAETCLQIGLSFSPMDADLLSGKMAFAD